ncbi:MAG: hypothetical protein H6797_05115 [Candidatus Nomurabacteria bacterium]|nr:MAG: hypothetical protein H6797_05115 [Candidatus Nomurabacteria bacterium]
MTEKRRETINLREQSVDVEQFGEIAHERHEAMKNAVERAERKQKSHQSEREMLVEARKLAAEVEMSSTDSSTSNRTEKRRGPITKKQLNSSFKSQMRSAEEDMTATERFTSRLIHAKPIERTTNIAASTIARPNAMLSGSIAAFIGITIVYFISKYYGFQLSGFETICAFIVGWILGLLYDYFSVMFHGRK